jgi:hypothetical protein
MSIFKLKGVHIYDGKITDYEEFLDISSITEMRDYLDRVSFWFPTTILSVTEAVPEEYKDRKVYQIRGGVITAATVHDGDTLLVNREITLS